MSRRNNEDRTGAPEVATDSTAAVEAATPSAELRSPLEFVT